MKAEYFVDGNQTLIKVPGDISKLDNKYIKLYPAIIKREKPLTNREEFPP